MIKQTIVSLLLLTTLGQGVAFAQSRKTVCLSIEPQCTVSNLKNFPFFTLGGNTQVRIYSEPLNILYKYRDYRAIWFKNNRLDTEKLYALMQFIDEVNKVKSINFSTHVNYLKQLMVDSRPSNVTVEYFATYLVLEVLDKVENKQGKFFENFKDLSVTLDSPSSVLKSSLMNGFVVVSAKKPVENKKNPPVAQPEVTPKAPTPVVPEAPTEKNEEKKDTVVNADAPATGNGSVKDEEVIPPVVVAPGTGSLVLTPKAIGLSSLHYETDLSEDRVLTFLSSLNHNIFVADNGSATIMTLELRKILRDAESHGLNPDDYWDLMTENNFNAGRVRNRTQFHEQLGRGLLRYLVHLSIGRVKPSQIDSFAFEKRDFKDLLTLGINLNGPVVSIGTLVENYVPNHPQYKELRVVLQNLRYVKAQGIKVNTLNRELSLYQMGKSNSHIANMRIRMALLGYKVRTGVDTYDAELDEALKNFSSLNGLTSKLTDHHIQKLNVSLDERIKQVEVNLEKIRFIPVGAESRYLFVNLAFSEIKLFDSGNVKMHFRTVNGRMNGSSDDKKTPSMTQVMRHVLLNPTWTVPAGMAYQSKIPLIRKNRDYADKNNFKAAQGFTEKRVWDPVLDRYIVKRVPDYVSWSSVDWDGFRPNSGTRYWIVQQPGYASTLGVVKFPLYDYRNQNRINEMDIYLHDTNERHLFANAKRLESSGCVRLQYPVELAAELLQGNLGYDIDKIRSYLPAHAEDEIDDDYTNMQINLRQPLTVHILYLTAEQGPKGEARFIEDQQAYQLDSKILAALEGEG